MSSILAVKMPAMPLDVQQRRALVGLGETVGEYVDEPVRKTNRVLGAVALASVVWLGIGYLGGRATR